MYSLCVYVYSFMCIHIWFFFSLIMNILVQVTAFIMLLRRSCSPLRLINTLSPCFIYFLPPLLIIWEMLWLFPSLSARSGSMSLPVCPAPGSLPYCEVGGKLFFLSFFFRNRNLLRFIEIYSLLGLKSELDDVSMRGRFRGCLTCAAMQGPILRRALSLIYSMLSWYY